MTNPVKTPVLVAEDDAALLDLVSRWLEAAGYQVTKARDGEGVIDAVRASPPAAIVMDLTMPRLDGFQVLAKMREFRMPPIPVLLLTGRVAAEDVRKAVSLGAKDYLAKPVERPHLLARLERMLSKNPPAPAEPPTDDGAPGGSHYLE